MSRRSPSTSDDPIFLFSDNPLPILNRAPAGTIHRLSLPISDLSVPAPPAPIIVAPRPDGLRHALSLPSLLPSQENPQSDLSIGPSSVRPRYRRDLRSLSDRQRRSLLRLISDLRYRFQQLARDCLFSGLFTPDEYNVVYEVVAPFANDEESSLSASETSESLPDFPPRLLHRDDSFSSDDSIPDLLPNP